MPCLPRRGNRPSEQCLLLVVVLRRRLLLLPLEGVELLLKEALLLLQLLELHLELRRVRAGGSLRWRVGGEGLVALRLLRLLRVLRHLRLR